MSEPVWGDAKFLCLHFVCGKLSSTKVSHSWRGAQMSKQHHARVWGDERVVTKILPMAAILAMKGLEAPETSLSPGDVEILKLMGIAT